MFSANKLQRFRVSAVKLFETYNNTIAFNKDEILLQCTIFISCTSMSRVAQSVPVNQSLSYQEERKCRGSPFCRSQGEQ